MSRLHAFSSLRAGKSGRIAAVAFLALLGLAVLALFRFFSTVQAQSAPADALPSDAQSSCTAATVEVFPTWFQSGTPAPNGIVNPANSVTFPGPTPSPAPSPTPDANCAFYQWSMQMFLWLTSPTPSNYGGGSHVFDSPVFYDVSPADDNGHRHFIQHVPGQLKFIRVRAAKPGPNGLPVIFAKDGRVLEVHPPQLSHENKLLLRNKTGHQVEAAQIKIENHKAVFLDQSGKPIPGAKPILPVQRGKGHFVPVQRFMMGTKPVFVDSSGNVIDTEEGQADGGVQLAQNSTLVYYTIMVNDVYAYFLTQTKDTVSNVNNAQFPTTQANLNSILQFAQQNGFPAPPDGTALTLELKASWVPATTVPDKTQYITIMATVPTYDTSNPEEWTPNGETQMELALVGLHVVGSVAGHPEMVWATFEHFGNTPNGAYQYANGSGTQTMQQNTAGNWLFTANNAGSPFNCMNQTAQGTNDNTGRVNIVANQPDSPCPGASPSPTPPIGPTNTIRWKAFGAAYDQQPNPFSPPWVSNSEVITVNNATQIPPSNSGRGQNLSSSQDVRNQYYLIGATWTLFGGVPTSIYGTPSPSPSPTPNEIGTSMLSNSTMETFEQGDSNLFGSGANGFNCFSCHILNTVPTSHVFCEPLGGGQFNCKQGIRPLPTPTPTTGAKRRTR